MYLKNGKCRFKKQKHNFYKAKAPKTSIEVLGAFSMIP